MKIFQKLKTIALLGKRKKDEKQIYSEIKNSFTFDDKLIYAGEILKFAYENFSNRIALIESEKTINYKEFYFRAIQLSKKLKNIGISPRDRVILYYENSLDFYISYFAIWQIGAIVVPLNIFLHEKELAYVIKDCGARLAIVSDGFKENWGKLLKSNLLEKLPQILTQDGIDWKTPVPKKIEEFKIETLDLDELCLLLYTSGTTGVPKGVMLSSRNIVTNVIQCYTRLLVFGKKNKEIFFSVLPLFHVFAQNTCMWTPILIGASIIVVKKIDRKLILEGLKKRPTIFFGFPALYGLLCLLKTAPLDSVRIFVSGADMLPDKIRAAFAIIYGRKICSGYGLTEASPVVALNECNEGELTDVVGKPFVGIECDIRDENEKSIEPGHVGSLWIKGDNVMLGYYKAPETTSEILKDGWLNTGDFATFNSKKKLAIKGRSKDLIIHKGFNIYPQEIENILMTHPSVVKVAVVGKDESLSGQVPIAYVEVRREEENMENILRELCASNLAQYKIPRKIIFMDDLPMNSTGKVDKKQLQFF